MELLESEGSNQDAFIEYNKMHDKRSNKSNEKLLNIWR